VYVRGRGTFGCIGSRRIDSHDPASVELRRGDLLDRYWGSWPPREVTREHPLSLDSKRFEVVPHRAIHTAERFR